MKRSDYLVHWTGKDIICETGELSESLRDQYVNRLYDILEKGFWMTRPPEELVGGHPQGPPAHISFSYHVPMTCFTEIRLSSAAKHSALYGLLGVAVDRNYVLQRWGSPVHYVRNHESEFIVGAFSELRYSLSKLEPSEYLVKAKRNAEYLGLFLKGMSSPRFDDFSMLNEREWRIVHHDRLVENHFILSTHQNPPPKYRLPVPAGSVRLIVVPDFETKKKVCNDSRFTKLFWSQGLYPAVMTLVDCENI